MAICKDYIERLYAGWLGKIIGVRLGSPIEGWTYQKILDELGEGVFSYIQEYHDYASDDDVNGPLFFLRAMRDYECSEKLTAEQIGRSWLNYAPYEHGFYWWGGYGHSTEHTAYMNLRAGIPAPLSGSIEMNGATVAEQIGGQIFIDTWGLTNPGNPERAARFARKAASVSHDGEGIYGGQFVASCIAQAFVERDIRKVIEKALSMIPESSTYAKVARAVMAFYDAHPRQEQWRECFKFIFDNYGYDKFPGNCHIIPNAAVMILAMLYGEGDFEKTLCICNMCGWDTDCNVGNVGTIMGTLVGLQGIDYAKWIAPVHDFLCCSCVMGSLNIIDIPWSVFFMAKIAYDLNGEVYPEKYKAILQGKAPRFHFALPQSTHSFRFQGTENCVLENGGSCLNIAAQGIEKELQIYYKTYYLPEDFTDSRYDPFFSPLLYPGQTVTAKVTAQCDCAAQLFVYDKTNKMRITGEKAVLSKGESVVFSLDIPSSNGCIERAGILFTDATEIRAVIDWMDFSGKPDYVYDLSRECTEVWTPWHKEISQLSRLRPQWYLESGMLHGSHAEENEAYTGDVAWTDVEVTATLMPVCGKIHQFMARVQGAIRCYAVRLSDGNKLQLLKKERHGIYRVLSETDYFWECGKEYTLTLKAQGNVLTVFENKAELLRVTDTDHPYLSGAAGFGVHSGHCAFAKLTVKGI